MFNLKKEQAELYNALKKSLDAQAPVSIQYLVDGTLYPAVVVSQLSEPRLSKKYFESIDGVCREEEGYAVDIEGTFTIQYIDGSQKTLFCENEKMYLDDWRLYTDGTLVKEKETNDV